MDYKFICNFFCRYILQISQWYSIHKILMRHRFILVEFVIKKCTTMIRQYCVNQVVIFGFIGELL